MRTDPFFMFKSNFFLSILGETAVMASVYGPIECKLQNMNIEKASVEVYYRSKSGMPSVSDRLREQIIKNTCEEALITAMHPRTAITIQLQEMDDRSGVRKVSPKRVAFYTKNKNFILSVCLANCLCYKCCLSCANKQWPINEVPCCSRILCNQR